MAELFLIAGRAIVFIACAVYGSLLLLGLILTIKDHVKRMKTLLICLGLLALAGCTDSEMAMLTSYGDRHKIVLYSGGQPVREWTSTGKVHTEESSDGYYFMDEATNRLVRVTGDLTIEIIK